MFGNSATFINFISRGIELSPNDIEQFVPLLITFCSLLMLLITTLHDNEFYNDDSGEILYAFFLYAYFSVVSFLVNNFRLICYLCFRFYKVIPNAIFVA